MSVPSHSRRRRRSGCIMCRIRKQRCDGSEPTCLSCLRSGSVCIRGDSGYKTRSSGVDSTGEEHAKVTGAEERIGWEQEKLALASANTQSIGFTGEDIPFKIEQAKSAVVYDAKRSASATSEISRWNEKNVSLEKGHELPADNNRPPKYAKSYVPLPISRQIFSPGCRVCKLRNKQCTNIYCQDYRGQMDMRTVPETIDFNKVRSWRKTCEETHGECCNDRYSEALAQQFAYLNLVDVVAGCVVTLPVSTPFVALSYVWGNVQTLKAKTNNFEALKKPGVFFREPYTSALPGTIHDAMHVVKVSDERYLWVDCLCIVQDGEKTEFDKMLKAMARIYASAEFTIVAADGENANHGLRGVGGPSQEREVSLQEISKSSEFPWDSPWASRGWTFQEALFSRRLLVFNTVVSWICGRFIYGESNASVWARERQHLGVPLGMLSLIPDKPSLGRWGMIIENYSSRNLTYEEDIGRALAGATEIMAATFPGGLLRGLPVFFFDIALLWQPRSFLKRRPGEPSWSWTGWKGYAGVKCLSAWHPFHAGVYRRSGTCTDWVAIAPLKPLATWSSTSEGDFSTNGTGFNGFYKYQALRYAADDALPTGWRRQSHPEGDFFTAADFTKSGSRYAFPLPAVGQFQHIVPTSPPSLLLCTAPISTVLIGSCLNASFAHQLPGVYLLMCQGVAIGSLELHEHSDLETYEGRPCELVAISEGQLVDVGRAGEYASLDYYIESQEQIGNGSFSPSIAPEDLSFYNVLCIERENGIAYRKGLGMMSKRRWSAVGAQVETIKLG